jgi:type IV secretion system protein VirB9
VNYSQTDIVPIRAKIRFSTLIILPASEEILDFTTGDKEFWIINGVHNLCYVHPAQAGARSNLNLITASGHVYSFLLSEISNQANADPDLKVFIEPKEESTIAGQPGPAQYVRATELQAYKSELAATRTEAVQQVQAAQARADAQITKYKTDYSGKLQFDYRVNPKGSSRPFLISNIYHDDSFTYIKCAAQEKPTIYEIKDGKPNLINFEFQNGVYIVPKIVDSGYLALGKRKLSFKRRG